VGDLIINIDGVNIKNSQDVVREVLKKQVGQKIKMEVLREGKKTEIYVTTAEMAAERAEQKAVQPEKKEWFGLRIASITPEIAKQLGLKAMDGVVVDTVDAGSIAQETGLRRGDVILEVNRRRIKNETEYFKAMGETKAGQGVLLLVNRGGSTFFVSLKEEK